MRVSIIFFLLFVLTGCESVGLNKADYYDRLGRIELGMPKSDFKQIFPESIPKGARQYRSGTVEVLEVAYQYYAFIPSGGTNRNELTGMEGQPQWFYFYNNALLHYGNPGGWPSDPEATLKQVRSGDWVDKEYHIDGLIITQAISKNNGNCASGAHYIFTLKGNIGPDSSFAMNRLLNNAESCVDATGRAISNPLVYLESDGGLLNDGYSLGDSFRKHSVKTQISNGKMCASSCAVAFLGGVKRVVEDKGRILFHAPYYNKKNELGKVIIDCNAEESMLNDLRDYYSEMTSSEVGERLFERTMWYCSAENGWTITGGDAAELFGISTE